MNGADGYFAMGGYATYVWSAYAVAAAVLIGLAAFAIMRARARGAELEALQTTLGRERRR
jgi:heme exporter protein D